MIFVYVNDKHRFITDRQRLKICQIDIPKRSSKTGKQSSVYTTKEYVPENPAVWKTYSLDRLETFFRNV